MRLASSRSPWNRDNNETRTTLYDAINFFFVLFVKKYSRLSNKVNQNVLRLVEFFELFFFSREFKDRVFYTFPMVPSYFMWIWSQFFAKTRLTYMSGDCIGLFVCVFLLRYIPVLCGLLVSYNKYNTDSNSRVFNVNNTLCGLLQTSSCFAFT